MRNAFEINGITIFGAKNEEEAKKMAADAAEAITDAENYEESHKDKKELDN